MAKFCGSCGNPIDEGAVFCDNCGARLDGAPAGQSAGPQPVPSPKKKKGVLLIAGAVVLLAVVLIAVLPRSKSGPEEDKPSGGGGEAAVSTEAPVKTKPAAQKPAANIEKPSADRDAPAEPEIEIEAAAEDLPDFEKYGIIADVKPGRTFDVTASVKNSDEIVTGKGRLDSFTREPVSQEIVDFMKENGADVAGYDVLRVNFIVEFPDSMVNRETMTFNGKYVGELDDYYNIDLFAESAEVREDTEGEEYHYRQVLDGGKMKDVFFWKDLSGNIENGTIYFHNDFMFLVPGGYDGLVCGYQDIRLPEDPLIYENYEEGLYHLLRLSGGDALAQESAEKPAEKPGEKPAEGTGEKLPYDDLGVPRDTDFAWIADVMSGEVLGEFIGKDKFIGKWKAEAIFDGVWELMTITIMDDGAVIAQPCQINYGDGWMDETGEEPYIFEGEFDFGGAGNVVGHGEYGTLDLYQFTKDDDTQYGLGLLTVPSGETGNVYLVRP